MNITRTLNARLVISHLGVSLVSIILMALFAGRFILQSATAETEHNLQGLGFAAGNALQLPIQELQSGRITTQDIKDLLNLLFADNPNMSFTVYRPDGSPMVDRSETLPPPADVDNAPEVVEALESGLGRGISIRNDEHGVEMMYIATSIQREIEVTGVLRLGLPMDPTRETARRSYYLLLLIASALAIGVAVVGWVLAKTLSRPIQVLTRAAESMEQGDLSVRVKPTGPEELERLAVAFNNMASRLQSNVTELRAFVANASHELRTPLTVVKLRTEALREGALEEPEIAMRFLGDIESEVDRLVRMVNDLLDLSRLEARMIGSQRSEIDLSAVAAEVSSTLSIRASHAEVDLKLEVEPNLPRVIGNEDQLRRVLYNLIENAIKYTPVGGRVEVLLRRGPNEKTVRVLVRDTGPGIAPEHLPHVFERFYRADTTQPRQGVSRGSGLGLAIAKSIVESHSGEIGVSSQLGNGTTFWADLPVGGGS